jgi:hypothetical protein
VAFSVPPAISLIRVRLNYDRALGTPRVSGMLVLTSIGILAGASHDLSGVR